MGKMEADVEVEEDLILELTSRENLITTGAEALLGGEPESSATTTIWASVLFKKLEQNMVALLAIYLRPSRELTSCLR